MQTPVWTPAKDCLIVGGGPAGLVAAVYLARFLRSCVVVDAGQSRARYIPVSRNVPGFAHGVSGDELLAELREQAARHGVVPRTGSVERLERGEGEPFVARLGSQRISARTVLLATGMVDVGPSLERLREAVMAGVVRVCPVCDAYEVRDRRIGVLGNGDALIEHAKFLRSYARDVTLLSWKTLGETDLEKLRGAAAQGFSHIDEPIVDLTADAGGRAVVTTESGKRIGFEVVYSLVGSCYRAGLAIALGARCNEDGELVVDERQRTTVPGLWAVGDITDAVNQISVACGQAAIAATDIHEALPCNWR